MRQNDKRGTMTDYGTKIAQLRAANRMTQAELGAKLNVTSQAVSKWENGLSEPDIESIRKICQIFDITFDEFFGAEPKQTDQEYPQETESTLSPTIAPATAPTQSQSVVLAYCDICDKPLHDPKEYQVTIEDGVQHTTCIECIPKKEEAKRKAREQQLAAERKARDEKLAAERKYRQDEEMHTFKKGLLWGILGAVVLAVINIIGGIAAKDELGVWPIIVMTVLGAYGGEAMVSQFIWGNSVWDVFGFFLRTLKLPGVIFTLSLDGILFLIFVKILGAILSAIVSVLLFIVGFVVTWIYAMIIFPLALIKQIREIKQMY